MNEQINKKGFRGYDPKGKKAEKERKAKEKDFIKRSDAMLKEVQELSRKYKIDIVGALQYHPSGVIPMVAFKDVIDQYQHKAEDNKDPKGKNIKTNLEL